MKTKSETVGYLYVTAISFFGSIFFLHGTPVFSQYLGLILIAGGLIWFSILHLQPTNKKSKK